LIDSGVLFGPPPGSELPPGDFKQGQKANKRTYPLQKFRCVACIQKMFSLLAVESQAMFQNLRFQALFIDTSRVVCLKTGKNIDATFHNG
jgi:hypothetical protein